MIEMPLNKLEHILSGAWSSAPGAAAFCGVSTDTRSLQSGQLFVALKGPNFDAGAFLAEAQKKGAVAAVAEADCAVPAGFPVLKVADTVVALGQLAKVWRNQFTFPFVGITGSNGKSTTKEMTAAVLSLLGPVLKTEGNLNNLIGLPLTLFRLGAEHKVAVCEMGMNAKGEIAAMTEILQPQVGVLTNVTSAHLEKLHTVEAVAAAKGELFAHMSPQGVIIVNDEDPWVRQQAAHFPGRKIHFGMQNSSDIKFGHVEMHGLDAMDLYLSVFGKDLKLHLPLPGTHNIMNALAALGVAAALDLDIQAASHALETFQPMPMRFEQVQLSNGVRLVNDCYNANPQSMLEAFRTVGRAKRAGRFVAVLADMLELGEKTQQLHEELGAHAAQLGVDELYLLGNEAEQTARGASRAGMESTRIHIFQDIAELNASLMNTVHAGDVCLVKASRGMKLERVVNALKQKFGI